VAVTTLTADIAVNVVMGLASPARYDLDGGAGTLTTPTQPQFRALQAAGS